MRGLAKLNALAKPGIHRLTDAEYQNLADDQMGIGSELDDIARSVEARYFFFQAYALADEHNRWPPVAQEAWEKFMNEVVVKQEHPDRRERPIAPPNASLVCKREIKEEWGTHGR